MWCIFNFKQFLKVLKRIEKICNRIDHVIFKIALVKVWLLIKRIKDYNAGSDYKTSSIFSTTCFLS